MLTREKELSETHTRLLCHLILSPYKFSSWGGGRLERDLREKMLAIVGVKCSLGLQGSSSSQGHCLPGHPSDLPYPLGWIRFPKTSGDTGCFVQHWNSRKGGLPQVIVSLRGQFRALYNSTCQGWVLHRSEEQAAEKAVKLGRQLLEPTKEVPRHLNPGTPEAAPGVMQFGFQKRSIYFYL